MLLFWPRTQTAKASSQPRQLAKSFVPSREVWRQGACTVLLVRERLGLREREIEEERKYCIKQRESRVAISGKTLNREDWQPKMACSKCWLLYILFKTYIFRYTYMPFTACTLHSQDTTQSTLHSHTCSQSLYMWTHKRSHLQYHIQSHNNQINICISVFNRFPQVVPWILSLSVQTSSPYNFPAHKRPRVEAFTFWKVSLHKSCPDNFRNDHNSWWWWTRNVCVCQRMFLKYNTHRQ